MFYIGIDLGGTNIAVGIVDENGSLIYKDSVPTGRERHYSEIIRDMVMLVEKIIQDSGINISMIKSIGIGTPGTANKKDGILIYANNINFKNVPLRSEIQKYIKLPVYLENDANCAALAESVFGAAKDVSSSITITLGTGIGGGVIIDNEIYSGFNGVAVELGHMVIVSGGHQCTCGRKGCWEAYASATALIRMTKEAAREHSYSYINNLTTGDLSKINAKTAFDAAREGDYIGKSIIDMYIFYIAEGLINVINVFQPHMIVIGGGVSKEGENLLKPLKRLVSKGVYCKGGVPQTEIKVAKMGNDAGIIGAAMLGLADS